MGTWNSRGLRGSTLEDLLNFTIERYKEHHLALIQKIPTPIKPIKIDKSKAQITLAYFDQKSTVDYIGTCQGIPICFDAKECAKNTFPLLNIHKHQIEFMEEFENQGGISFFIIFYTERNETYYVPFKHILFFYNRAANGGRKSIRFDELENKTLIKSHKGVPLHFLLALSQDINSRE